MEWGQIFPTIFTMANSHQTFSSCCILTGLSTNKSATYKSWTLKNTVYDQNPW